MYFYTTCSLKDGRIRSNNEYNNNTYQEMLFVHWLFI